MDLAMKIFTGLGLLVLLTPLGIVVGGAAYWVYSPKVNSYNVITECDACSHKDTPYCAACWRCKWNPLYWVYKQMIYCGPTFRERQRLARKWRNDMQPNITTCRSCGKPIVWKKTASGKSMPCEAYPIDIVPTPGSKFKALDKYGKLIPCVKAEASGYNTELAWEPHWSNCDSPDRFRRR